MTATLLPPSAPPSLANPLQIGQMLWRIVLQRGGPELREGTVTDLKGHYAEITTIRTNTWANLHFHARHTEWIDARDIHSQWHRHRPTAVIMLASLHAPGTAPWIASELIRTGKTTTRLRPGRWGKLVYPVTTPHPKRIASAFRWLAAKGLAQRHGGRHGRWQILQP